MTAAQIAEMASMSDADMLTLAYEEAAEGDLRQALHDAARDVLALEAKIQDAAGRISFGYVRGAVTADRN